MWYAIDFANDPKSPPIKRFKSSAGNTCSTNTRNTGHTIIDYNVCVPLEGRTNTVKCVSSSLSLSLSVYCSISQNQNVSICFKHLQFHGNFSQNSHSYIWKEMFRICGPEKTKPAQKYLKQTNGDGRILVRLRDWSGWERSIASRKTNTDCC